MHDAKAHAKTRANQVGTSVSEHLKANQEHMTDTLRKNAQHLQESAKSTADSVRQRAADRASEVAASAFDKAQELRGQTGEYSASAQARLADGAKRLRDSSSSVAEAIDPRASARRTRNRLVMLGFSAVVLYGFASAAPNAMATYALESVKIQEGAKLKRKDDE